MELSKKGISNRESWKKLGYRLPMFDIDEVNKRTKENPTWIHFGAGNLFRAFQANVAQNLLNEGVIDRGIIVAEGYDYEIIDKMYKTHDNLSILATLKADGNIDKTVIASISESLKLDPTCEYDHKRLKEIFENKSLQMASFTITEKGYSLVDGNGEVLKGVGEDFEVGPLKPNSYMGKVTALLYNRFKSGKLPIAMVSMDNCSHNGDKLYAAISEFAQRWAGNGLVETEFVDYINDEKFVTFPWSMIDKITPRPDDSVEKMIECDGIEGLEAVITSKNTYVAPFVNSEECEYLVIEDKFPNGRQELEKGGLLFTDRETVDKVEKMKVCTCLNPLHTALAVFGCLLGYRKIADEMKDEDLKKMIETIGYTEGLPVVSNPKVIDPKEFIDTVINVRFPNPFMPDTPQRIATDTSQKLGIRFGETIKMYEKSDSLKVDSIKVIPLVYAGWLRYLIAVDDNGEKFDLSPDPLIETLKKYTDSFELGKTEGIEKNVEEILSMENIFGIDLCTIGMSEIVIKYFKEMLDGKGAVRSTIKKYVK